MLSRIAPCKNVIAEWLHEELDGPRLHRLRRSDFSSCVLSLASSGCGRGRRLSWRRASAHGEYVSMATGCDRGCGGWSGECRHRARGLTAECTTWGIAEMVFAFASCSIRAMSPGHTLRKARVMQ